MGFTDKESTIQLPKDDVPPPEDNMPPPNGNRGNNGRGGNNDEPPTGGNGNPDDGIPNDPTVQDQFRKKVEQIREDKKLTSNRQMQRNVADATYDINGQTGELPAISGPEKDGFTNGPTVGNNHFQPPGYRDNPGTMDSEYKILEKIADNYWSNDSAERARVTGEIRLYTELKPCLSCRDVIQQL